MENIRIYHLCVSCKEGLMFRSRQDYIRFINNMALLAYKYKVRILAFAVMSNHYHICIMTDDFRKFFRGLKVSYSNYYRHKYKAGLPKTSDFSQEAAGNLHIVTMLAYVLRNPVHHGLVGHPFAYPYSSAGCYFSYNGALYSIGHAPVIKRISTVAPDEFNSDREGMIDPMTFVDYRMMETLFTSSGRFMYFMSRYSGPKWEREQKEENASVKPINIQTIEGKDIDSKDCIQHEKGHGKLLIPDQLLCEWIDGKAVPHHGRTSFTQLDLKQKMGIIKKLRSRWKISEEQAGRCLYCRPDTRKAH
ncbi:MAG TPA: transposase [Candidatus Coprenecus pullistercoris]|nr:transposase [Candidatus Coprenecus pullistercoris]